MARYIDADALIKRLGINNDCTECSYCTRKCYCSWNPDPGEICIAISEQPTVTIKDTADEIKVTNCNDNDLISRADALSCFHDWIDQRGDVHTADEMPEYQQIEELPSIQPDACENACEIERKSNDCISRQAVLEICDRRTIRSALQVGREVTKLPSAQPEIIRCKDCLHWKHSEIRPNYCEVWDWCNTAEDFCSFAERRTDGKTN